MTLTGPSGAGAAPTISPWSGSVPVISPRPVPAPASRSLCAWSLCAWSLSEVAVISDSLPVVVRALPGPVAAQRAARPRGIGPLEDPVLPGREPAEYLRLAGFRAGEAEVGLHAGQRVGGEAGALLDHQPDLIVPVQPIQGLGDQAEPHRVCGGQVLPGGGRGGRGVRAAAEEPDLQPAQAVAHRQQ